MIIDFHTHCFPGKLLPRALDGLSFTSGGLIYYFDGSADGLAEAQKGYGVGLSAVMNIAVSPRQMRSVNDFAISLLGKEGIIPFGSVHPDGDYAEELLRLREAGIKGVKLHPEFQEYEADDDKMIPLYRKLSEYGFIVLFHCGSDYSYRPPWKCTPAKLKKALKYLDTDVVAAHWGGLDLGDDVLKELAGLPLYFDTSNGYSHLPKYLASEIIEKHGADRILFGTDMPWQTPEMGIRYINTLGLSDDEKNGIFYGNAERLLGVKL